MAAWKGKGNAPIGGPGIARAPAAGRRGVDVEFVEPLGVIRYHYRRDGRLIAKRVHFFQFEFRSGSPDDHDHEIEDARWVPMERAINELTYPGEREMVRRVLSKTRADR